MNGDTHGETNSSSETPRWTSIVAGVLGFLLLAVVCVGVLLSASGLLVWGTGLVETWLGLPAMSMLVAFVGLSLIVSIYVAHARIVTAIHEQWDPFEMLRGHMESIEEDYDEDDDEGSEFAEHEGELTRKEM